jgi:IS5 family transposase
VPRSIWRTRASCCGHHRGATLIAASPSTKNKDGKRDPEMSSSKKANQRYFGMKAHVGVDAESGRVHMAGVTTGKVYNAKVMDRLIREDDYGGLRRQRYASDQKLARRKTLARYGR